MYESYTTVHTYPIRIRTSQRISQQSMRITKKAEPVTSAYTEIYGYERPHVSDTQRIRKFPLWRAYIEISRYTERIRRTRVDARCIRIKNLRIQKSPDTCGRGLSFFYNLSGPIGDFCQNFTRQIFFSLGLATKMVAAWSAETYESRVIYLSMFSN